MRLAGWRCLFKARRLIKGIFTKTKVHGGRACVAGDERGGGGGSEKSSNPPPFIPSSLPPTPFDTCYEGQRSAQTWKHPQSPPPLSVYSRGPLSSVWKPERNVLTVLMQSNLFLSLLSTSSLTSIVKLLIEPFHWRTDKSKKKNYQICDYICKVNLLGVKI